MQRYNEKHVIGEGAFGVVLYAEKKSNGYPVAIKRMRDPFCNWSQVTSLRELKAIKSISFHPNVVAVYDIILEPDQSLYFVFEYMSDGTLNDFIKRHKEKRISISEKIIRSFTKQMLRGLDHIHSQGFMHRDIKPENILLSGNLCKIADFSLARRACRGAATNMASPATSYVSTRWYRAPEVLLCDHSYTNAVDVFGVGCVVAEMYELRPIFPGTSELVQLDLILRVLGAPTKESWPEGHRVAEEKGISLGRSYPKVANVAPVTVVSPETPVVYRGSKQFSSLRRITSPATSPSALPFILQMLQVDPKRRLTCRQALEHDFFLTNEETAVRPLNTSQ